MSKIKFRFQDLEIWQMAMEIAEELFDIADELEGKRLYRFQYCRRVWFGFKEGVHTVFEHRQAIYF
jgi:hypothetical protein